MADVETHYASLLAPIYAWMAGGFEQALETGANDLAGWVGTNGLAIDLGAGFGMHAIPLARSGYRVLAIDSSPYLIEQLRSASQGLAVQAFVADLRQFRQYLPSPSQADLIVCLGDTLTHLPELSSIEQLARDVASSLAPGGRFIATFRDYTHVPSGDARFIPVRHDADRIHTCFLEAQPSHVVVHDILHTRQPEGWSMRVSSYPKLRLSPEAVQKMFQSAGLTATISAGPRGMVRLIADR